MITIDEAFEVLEENQGGAETIQMYLHSNDNEYMHRLALALTVVKQRLEAAITRNEELQEAANKPLEINADSIHFQLYHEPCKSLLAVLLQRLEEAERKLLAVDKVVQHVITEIYDTLYSTSTPRDLFISSWTTEVISLIEQSNRKDWRGDD